MGESAITGINEKRLSKDRLVRLHDLGCYFSGYPPPHYYNIKEKPEVIILHVGTNVSKISREIRGDLLYLKSFIIGNPTKLPGIFFATNTLSGE